MGGGNPGAPWRQVVKAEGPREGRGGLLSGLTERRARWWDLDLDCGHRVQRSARYGPHKDGYPRQHGGTQHRSRDDVLPAPKHVRCEHCPENPTGCPLCGSDDYDTELGEDDQPDYANGLKTCQECGEQWV
jgi:hypothetical protein